jgi:hypothetical protein
MNPAWRKPKLTSAAIEKAALTSKLLYPQDMPCMACQRRWMQHRGLLCPIQDGYVSSLRSADGGYIIVPPKFGTDLFIPDEDYYKRPDFEVV